MIRLIHHILLSLVTAHVKTSLVVQMVKHLPTMWETWVQSLGQEDLLEKEMATHSSILAWEIPWTEEPGRLQSMELQRVGHDWATSPSPSPSCDRWINQGPVKVNCLTQGSQGDWSEERECLEVVWQVLWWSGAQAMENVLETGLYGQSSKGIRGKGIESLWKWIEFQHWISQTLFSNEDIKNNQRVQI